VALVCLTSLPLLMLIMGEFQFARLLAVLAHAACDSVCGTAECSDRTGLIIFALSEIRYCKPLLVRDLTKRILYETYLCYIRTVPTAQ
jgi:hypothetical protein